MVKTEEEISIHFGIFLEKFYSSFPEFKNRPLYLTGESYAGHYIPYMSSYVYNNEYKSKGIDLKGIAIGNGWVSPTLQYLGYSQFSYNNNLISLDYKTNMDIGITFCRILISAKLPFVT
jgi:carboxypeptidase C (cathepsin A)